MQEIFFGQVDEKQLFETIANLSTQHAMTWSSSLGHFDSKNTPTPLLTRDDDRKYHGIMIQELLQSQQQDLTSTLLIGE